MSANLTANELGRFLEDRVRSSGANAVIFYNDLAAHFNLPEVDERWLQHPLCKLFEVLDHEDARKVSPFRTALVISKDKNMPGAGFFKVVPELRNPKPKLYTETEKMKFFIDELHALAKCYSPIKQVSQQ
ncbi:MAG TPA: hypothetical protein PKC18_02355 [Lacipirellulaceae bacterium]|nr:hypothetical protein [Verrucomicrobiota bacterium]HMO83742.1 hypothetical protein [Lacipirellulaceae bacterium]